MPTNLSETTLEKLTSGFADLIVLRQIVNPRLSTLTLWLQFNLKNYVSPPQVLTDHQVDQVWERWRKYVELNG